MEEIPGWIIWPVVILVVVGGAFLRWWYKVESRQNDSIKDSRDTLAAEIQRLDRDNSEAHTRIHEKMDRQHNRVWDKLDKIWAHVASKDRDT